MGVVWWVRFGMPGGDTGADLLQYRIFKCYKCCSLCTGLGHMLV